MNKDDQDYLFFSLCTGSGLTETEEDLDEWKDDCSSEDSDVSMPRCHYELQGAACLFQTIPEHLGRWVQEESEAETVPSGSPPI